MYRLCDDSQWEAKRPYLYHSGGRRNGNRDTAGIRKERHERMKREVVIIGGGPAGLAAAIEAKRDGCDVLLVD